MPLNGPLNNYGGFLPRLKRRLDNEGVGRGLAWIAKALWTYPTNRLGCWYSTAFRSSREFVFQGNSYRYFYHRYNNSWRNERSVEVPIIWRMVSENAGRRILELGNVLSHYHNVRHDVLDKFEKAPGVINQDVVDFCPTGKYDLIVGISTLEHVGWDEEPRNPTKILRAVEHLKNCLAPGGSMALTVAIGYNPNMDALLRNGQIRFTAHSLLKRISRGNDWVEVDWPDVQDVRQGYPFLWANAILVGIYRTSSAGAGGIVPRGRSTDVRGIV